MDRILAIGLCLLISGTALKADWCGWRGDGSGVSGESHVPYLWNERENISWRAPISGKGVSSPIVHEHRVFLTTAASGTQRNQAKFLVWSSLGLCSILVLLFHFLRRRPRRVTGPPLLESSTQLPFLYNVRLGAWFSLLFLAATAVSECLINVEGGFAYRWITGSPSRIWFVSGAASALGLAAALYVLPRALSWRIAIALLVVPATCYFLFTTVNPNNYAQNKSHVVETLYALLNVTVGVAATTSLRKPALALGGLFNLLSVACVLYWHATINHRFCYLRYRVCAGILAGMLLGIIAYELLRTRPGGPLVKPRISLGSWVSPCLALLLTAMVVVHFYGANFLLPRFGLMRSTVCIDARTGNTLWQQGYLTTDLERVVPLNSYATPTPVTDGRHIVSYFGNAGAMCLTVDGQIKWINRSLPFPANYGAATSPVIFSNCVYIVSDNLQSSYLVALDINTGKPIWKVSRSPSWDSYGTPILGHFGGKARLFVAGAGTLACYDALTGEGVWRIPIPNSAATKERPIVVQSVVIAGDTLFVGGTYRNEKLSAYKLDTDNPDQEPCLLWTTAEEVLGYASPLVVSEHIFTVTHDGALFCIDRLTGDVDWSEPLEGTFTASPIFVDGKVFLLNDQGITFVILPADNYTLLSAKSSSFGRCRPLHAHKDCPSLLASAPRSLIDRICGRH